MNDRIDDILKQALAPTEEPDFWLNQKILNQAKETDEMERDEQVKRDGMGRKWQTRRKWRKFRWTPGVVLSIILAFALGTTGVYAAYRFLSAGQAAEKAGDDRLAEAFASEGAVRVDETQHFAGYDVTFLGIVSGDGISEMVMEKSGKILDNRTYAVVAVSCADGTPFPEKMSDETYNDLQFFVSPLIQGCDPVRYNFITMNGSYVQFVENGVLYRIIGCDNIEIFADRQIWLCVSDGSEYNEEAYVYGEESGMISRNEEYEGVNALFSLPVDQTLADPAAAEAYMELMEPERSGTAQEEEEAYRQGVEEADGFMENVTPGTIARYAERLEDSVHVFGEEEDGVVYRYVTAEGKEIAAYMDRATEFPDSETGMSPRIRYMHDESGVESLTITTFTLNEDGTVTAAVWIPKKQ